MVEVRRLSPAELDNFLAFMDGPAFATNPEWMGCYCQFYLNAVAESASEHEVAEQNRQAACDRIKSGEMQGYLAFEGEKTIGWMAANKANNFKLLPQTDENVARILCFVIDSAHQGQGVSKALLNFAIDDLTSRGFERVEAGPRAADGFAPDGYRGKLSTFLNAGFIAGSMLDDLHVLVEKKLEAKSVGPAGILIEPSNGQTIQ